MYTTQHSIKRTTGCSFITLRKILADFYFFFTIKFITKCALSVINRPILIKFGTL